MKKIMFICTGNICRSAMAHQMIIKKLKEQNKNAEIYSCGIFAQNGDIPTKEAIETMEEYEINLKSHRATNIKNSDIKNMDIILCATTAHKNNVVTMYPQLKNKIFTIKEYAGYPQNDLDIKDPWGYAIQTYRNCAKEIEKCLDKIIENL
ncbi:MAG: low molecular weight protein arginine phosphatase [Clostridia bacterium]|nr:low molecular weight protein arginine phosphatase [Clostridia bacterium]